MLLINANDSVIALQVFVGVIQRGPNNVELESSFKNRDSIDYKKDLGETIGKYLQ